MKAVILAGGQGTRLREETEFRPKPMVEIGGKPILWHIMKNLSLHEIKDFIICLGYKGDLIKDYFLNYEARTNDITVSIGAQKVSVEHNSSHEEEWKVTLSDTGPLTMTGGRILKIQKYTETETFLCTYGDGLADVDIPQLIEFHNSHGKIATVTSVRPRSRFGSIEINNENDVTNFAEKPRSEQWVNGGFFIFEPEIFDYLTDNCILETNPLEKLAADGELAAFKHEGFWQPMDTFRESIELNDLWNSNSAPWRNWK